MPAKMKKAKAKPSKTKENVKKAAGPAKAKTPVRGKVAKPLAKAPLKPAAKSIGKSAAKPPVKETAKVAKAVSKTEVAPAKRADKKARVETAVVETKVAPVAASIVPDEEIAEIVLTDAEGRRFCRVGECDQVSTVDGYCRFHYLAHWKKIQNRKKILADGKLERYIEELTARYADKFVELLRKDLRTEKDFMAAMQELELDDSSQSQEDDDKSYIEEIRGMSTEETVRDDDF